MNSKKQKIDEILSKESIVTPEEWSGLLRGIRKINVQRHELQKSVVPEFLDVIYRKKNAMDYQAKEYTSSEKENFQQSVLNAIKALSMKGLDWNEGVPNFSEDGQGRGIAQKHLEVFRKYIHRFENRSNRSEYVSTLSLVTPVVERSGYANYFFDANWGSKFLSVCQGFSNYEEILLELKRANFDFDLGVVKEQRIEEGLTFKEKLSYYKSNPSVCGWSYVFATGNVELIKKAVDILGIPESPVAVFNSLLDLSKCKRIERLQRDMFYSVENLQKGMKLLNHVCLLSDEDLALLVNRNTSKNIFKNLVSIYEVTETVGMGRVKEVEWGDYEMSPPPFALMLADYTLSRQEKEKVWMELNADNSFNSELSYAKQYLPKNKNIYNLLLIGQLKSREPYFEFLNGFINELQPVPLVFSVGNKNKEQHLDFLKNNSELFIKDKQRNYWLSYNGYNMEDVDNLLARERPELLDFIDGDKNKSPLVAMIVYRLINRDSRVVPRKLKVERKWLSDESYEGFPLDAVLDFALIQRPYYVEILNKLKEKCLDKKSNNYYGARVALDIHLSIRSNHGYLQQIPKDYKFNIDETAMIIRALATMGKQNKGFSHSLTLEYCSEVEKSDDVKIQADYLSKLWERLDFSQKSRCISPIFKESKMNLAVKGDLFRWAAASLQEWNSEKSWKLNTAWMYNLKRLLYYKDEASDIQNSMDLLLSPLGVQERFEFMLQLLSQLENKEVKINDAFVSCPDEIKTPEQYREKMMISFLKRNENFMSDYSSMDFLNESQKQAWSQIILKLDKNDSEFINKEWSKAHLCLIDKNIKRSPGKSPGPPALHRF